MLDLANYLIDIVVTIISLIVAGKLVETEIDLSAAAICALIAALLGWLPEYGAIVSTICLFFLIRFYTRAPIWPDVILVVGVARVLAMMLTYSIRAVLG